MPDPVARRELRADCTRCFALCCVAPAFAAGADFALAKPAGQPCRHLRAEDFGCGIHADLRPRGFAGCTAFDCFGAGQQVAQVTFGGRDWRRHPELAAPMFAALPVLRQVHELRWLVAEALALPAARAVHGPLRAARADLDAAAALSAADLPGLDVAGLRERVNPHLRRASALARAGAGRGVDHAGADLVGARLRGADLTAASLRGARLVGADLRDARLRRVDFTGADLRGADLRGADLTDALFLTDAQLAAARGDRTTRLSVPSRHPDHWVRPRGAPPISGYSADHTSRRVPE